MVDLEAPSETPSQSAAAVGALGEGAHAISVDAIAAAVSVLGEGADAISGDAISVRADSAAALSALGEGAGSRRRPRRGHHLSPRRPRRRRRPFRQICRRQPPRTACALRDRSFLRLSLWAADDSDGPTRRRLRPPSQILSRRWRLPQASWHAQIGRCLRGSQASSQTQRLQLQPLPLPISPSLSHLPRYEHSIRTTIGAAKRRRSLA